MFQLCIYTNRIKLIPQPNPITCCNISVP
uniref:Uncharacterized protein n=1 Tax=Arundo donax TaxID=35708 RepID=A0A0A8Z7H9_ARUDO